MNQKLVLRNRVFMLDRANKLMVVGSMVLVFLVTPLSILFILDLPLNAETLYKVIGGMQKHITDAFHEEPVESSFDALMYASFPVFLIYMYLASKNERLILTSIGIRYVSALPEPFDVFYPGWFVRWDQITRARLDQAPFGRVPSLSPLTLTTRINKRHLRPHFWVNPETWKPVVKRRFGIRVEPGLPEQLENTIKSDLVKYVRSHITDMEMNINIEAVVAGKKSFNLEDNPWSGGMSVALLLLLGYALVDTFIFKTEVFAGRPPLEVYAAGGVLVAGVAAFLLYRARLPLYIYILLPVMLGLAFAAVVHPAILRINQLTDTSGLASYTYVRQVDRRYFATDDGPPPISIDYPADYWSQFMPGSTHEFELRKGGLGFWQLSETPLRESYYDYYETLRENRNGK